MEGRTEGDLDPELLLEGPPEVSSKGLSVVSDYLTWLAESLDPAPDEGLGAGLGAGVGHRDGLQPTATAIKDGQEVAHTLAFWHWTDDVNVEVAESSLRSGKLPNRGMVSFMTFHLLTCVAVSDVF